MIAIALSILLPSANAMAVEAYQVETGTRIWDTDRAFNGDRKSVV